ncbi:hypothetical protein QFC21_006987 [Naganishia friedmannii]|uniref:Uncharacterized protein n=1 Tax=Naganishia friedmannii TaxID=89922 RepID=A0ACC2UZ08_9TREE|nr:hypothetical protein QFC21_006987 [Naganishia friedmannii]
MGTDRPSTPERLLQEKMAALTSESAALDAEDAKDVLMSKIHEKAAQEGDHALLKVCLSKNSRELNKCNADTIRTWAKSAGLKGISRLGKAALVHEVALFRNLPDAKEMTAVKDVCSPMTAPVVENGSHLALFAATDEDEMPVASPTAFEKEEEWRTRRGEDEQLLDDLPDETRREALQIVGGEDEDEDEDEEDEEILKEVEEEESEPEQMIKDCLLRMSGFTL